MRNRTRAPEALEVLFDGDEAIIRFDLPQVPGVSLTTAESQVLLDLLGGYSNDAIARRRERSTRTVANQVASIFRKVGVRSRLELAAGMAIVTSRD